MKRSLITVITAAAIGLMAANARCMQEISFDGGTGVKTTMRDLLAGAPVWDAKNITAAEMKTAEEYPFPAGIKGDILRIKMDFSELTAVLRLQPGEDALYGLTGQLKKSIEDIEKGLAANDSRWIYLNAAEGEWFIRNLREACSKTGRSQDSKAQINAAVRELIGDFYMLRLDPAAYSFAMPKFRNDQFKGQRAAYAKKASDMLVRWSNSYVRDELSWDTFVMLLDNAREMAKLWEPAV
ncbi:MAG: hypothetical protein NTY45_06995 [Elusimicrobia bacterium]|nr:hypothetical protein [Elusimicrobiota bacterium]